MALAGDTGANAPVNARVCVIGAGPCGLTSLKNLLALGLTDIVCYDDGNTIGGNWAFDERPERISVYASTHLISSRKWSEFEDFPMPGDYPDFPSHAQMLAYFQDYAAKFGVLPYIRLRTRVERAELGADGRWLIHVVGPDGSSDEVFDFLLVCSGHHRQPFTPESAGPFAGRVLHSSQYKRAAPYNDERVLVVGAGNSGCDIAFDISRVARRTCISMRRGYCIIPKMIFGRPVDDLYAQFGAPAIRMLPRRLVQRLFAALLRLVVGPWEQYGLQPLQTRLLETHPTLNSNILDALRDGSVVPRVGIERFDGTDVHFADGKVESFDTIVWATGFRFGFSFLDPSVVDWQSTATPPLYLKMMHRRIANLFFIGHFQPLGCIWSLADRQARIAALQIAGQLDRPADIASRIDREVAATRRAFEQTPRHAIEVDYHDFGRELAGELARRRPAQFRRPSAAKLKPMPGLDPKKTSPHPAVLE